MKIKVCNKCGAVRTGKVCSKCQEAQVMMTVIEGALAGAELAQTNPGLVAAMLDEMKSNLDDDVLDEELEEMFGETISMLRQRALDEGPSYNSDMMFDIYEEVKRERGNPYK